MSRPTITVRPQCLTLDNRTFSEAVSANLHYDGIAGGREQNDGMRLEEEKTLAW